MVSYRCVVTHHRFAGVRFSFRYRTRMWLTDLDAPERRGHLARMLCSVRPADHLGDPGQSLRHNVERFLRLNGFERPFGRILMLSQARGLGFVFDPITVFWCHDPDDRLACLILEVRNTFGDRHCYLVHPDSSGRASTDKAFYVSPFFPVDGRYETRTRLSDDLVRVHVTLRRGTGPPALTATLNGAREQPGALRAMLTILANPVTARWTVLRIHYQSRRLRRRGLSPHRRRTHVSQPGVRHR